MHEETQEYETMFTKQVLVCWDHVLFFSLMTVNVGNSVLTSFLSLLNVQLSILDLGLPSLASHCFLHITTTTTLSALDKLHITTTTTLSSAWYTTHNNNHHIIQHLINTHNNNYHIIQHLINTQLGGLYLSSLHISPWYLKWYFLQFVEVHMHSSA